MQCGPPWGRGISHVSLLGNVDPSVFNALTHSVNNGGIDVPRMPCQCGIADYRAWIGTGSHVSCCGDVHGACQTKDRSSVTKSAFLLEWRSTTAYPLVILRSHMDSIVGGFHQMVD